MDVGRALGMGEGEEVGMCMKEILFEPEQGYTIDHVNLRSTE